MKHQVCFREFTTLELTNSPNFENISFILISPLLFLYFYTGLHVQFLCSECVLYIKSAIYRILIVIFNFGFQQLQKQNNLSKTIIVTHFILQGSSLFSCGINPQRTPILIRGSAVHLFFS